MTGLREDLHELSASLPRLGEQVSELAAAARELEGTSSSLLDEVEDARAELSVLLTRARSALPGLTVQVEAAHGRLEGATAGATTVFAEARTVFQEAHDGIDGTGDRVRSAAAALRASLFGAGTRIDQAARAVDFEPLEAAARAGVSRLGAASAALDAEVPPVEAAAREAQTSCEGATQAVLASLKSLTDTIEKDASALVSAVSQLARQHRQRVDGLLDDVRSSLHQALTASSDAATDNVVEPLSASGEKLHDALEALVAEGRQGATVAEHGRVGVETAVTEAERSWSGLTDSISAIDKLLRDLK